MANAYSFFTRSTYIGRRCVFTLLFENPETSDVDVEQQVEAKSVLFFVFLKTTKS